MDKFEKLIKLSMHFPRRLQNLKSAILPYILRMCIMRIADQLNEKYVTRIHILTGHFIWAAVQFVLAKGTIFNFVASLAFTNGGAVVAVDYSVAWTTNWNIWNCSID